MSQGHTEDRELPIGAMGYAIMAEQKPLLMSQGMSPHAMLKAVRENKPTFNVDVHPSTLFAPLDQKSQGACQGHALALIFTICYWLATGRVDYFSRAAAYYLSQKKDGIQGDRGSTLSAGQWVATQHGLCLEEDWPYPPSYDPRQPAGISFPFKLVASQPTRDYELIAEALDMGLPVQDGIIWDNSVSRTIVTNYVGNGGGGHSTTLWTKKGSLYRRINSWGMWDGDGCNENEPKALKQQVEHRYSSHVIYAPEGMIYPELQPVKV
jgi:hypothetical protein